MGFGILRDPHWQNPRKRLDDLSVKETIAKARRSHIDCLYFLADRGHGTTIGMNTSSLQLGVVL